MALFIPPTMYTWQGGDENVKVEEAGTYEEGPSKGWSRYRAFIPGIDVEGFGTCGHDAVLALAAALADVIRRGVDYRDAQRLLTAGLQTPHRDSSHGRLPQVGGDGEPDGEAGVR